MKNYINSIPSSPLLAVLVLALGLASPASAAVCKDVVFTVTNNHFEQRQIEILSVKYLNPHKGGKVQTEDVRNKVCNFGATCSTSGDNLSNAARVDLNAFQVVFRHRNHDGTWSKSFITQPFAPKYRKCKDGKKYGPIVVTDSR